VVTAVRTQFVRAFYFWVVHPVSCVNEERGNAVCATIVALLIVGACSCRLKAACTEVQGFELRTCLNVSHTRYVKQYCVPRVVTVDTSIEEGVSALEETRKC
jgi:hypothetical protein